MKKETLIEIILANIGGLFIAIGLGMICIIEWNMRNVGITLLLIGLLNLIAIIPVHKKFHKADKKTQKKVIKIKPQKIMMRVITFILALIIGFGISEIIAKQNIVLGIILLVIGLIISILSYPIYQYFKTDKLKLIKTTLGTVGCILLVIGMCMTFLGTWNLMLYGTIIGLIGVTLLLIFVYINRKNNVEYYIVDTRFIVLVVTELIGGFLTVFGIVKVYNSEMSVSYHGADLVIGLLSCCIGFFICALILPIYIYLKTNNIYDKKLKISLKNRENIYPKRNIIAVFFIYGFVGWLVEFISFGVTNGIFVNRGFLHLPILPIYGFGGAMVTMIFSKKQQNVFIKSAIIVSILEYITSVILEKSFGFRWWDYSKNPLNINGRVCLLNSLMFGLGGYVMAKFISPYLNLKLNAKNIKVIRAINLILTIAVTTDFIYTLFHLNIGVGITTI